MQLGGFVYPVNYVPQKEEGGWLNKYAEGGDVGDPDDPKPAYWKGKIYKGPTQFDECEGEGCSKQATKGVASLYNLDYSSLSPQDAWYKRSAVIKEGGKEIYNTSSKNNIDSIYGDLRIGDFVSLDRPGEPHSKDVSKVEGYDLSDNEQTEHLGYVVGFDENGTPLIKHGHQGNLIAGAKSYVQPITDISLPDIGYNYKVNSIYRAKPLLNDDRELNNKYYRNISPSIPLSFYDKENVTDDKQNFINAYNKNSDKFQTETGLSAEEVAAIGNIGYGIFGNESKFNKSVKRPIKQLAAEALYSLGLRKTAPSLGPTQLKYEQLNSSKNETRKGKLLRSLRVKKEDVDNVFLPTNYDAVSKATFAALAENYRNLKTNPKFKYNSENNTVLGNVPIGLALAKSWQNPSLKNVEETLQKGDSDYANSAYKNMSELEGKMFPVTLPEVVVKGKKKEDGGWLSKYKDGGTMQEYQENYNDSSVSMGPGFVGMGNNTKGRNYSPAWGGQFAMGGNVPGSVGFTYARTQGIPSKGPHRNQTDVTDASAQNGKAVSDNTSVKKPVIKLSADEINQNKLKNAISKASKKEQSTVQSRGSTPDVLRKQAYEDAQKAELKNQLLKGADVATDVMQVGNFIPHPIGQAIGKVGNVLGGWLDSYEAINALNEGNYGDAAMNAASVALPMVLGAKGYRRDMWNTEPGSVADRIASLGNREGRYIHLTPPNRLKNNPVIKEGVNFNRSLLGALGAETAYDSYQNGGEMSFYQNGLDWTPKNISKQGSKIKKDDNGYWNPDNWGKPVEIGSNKITMDGVYQPLIGISDEGDVQYMHPGQDYKFKGNKVTEYPIAQDGWVQRAANANLNFWEKCRLASSADNGGIRGGGGGGVTSPKYKNPYEEISDIKGYDKDQRKAFQKSLPEGIDIADWVAVNRDTNRMNALLRNPDYDKYTDSTGTLVPEYQNSARQFDPYYLYYKPAFVGKKQITPEDVLKYHQSQPGGLAGYKELVNRRYMPEQKKQGGWLDKYK
jgi:hypothetical protein